MKFSSVRGFANLPQKMTDLSRSEQQELNSLKSESGSEFSWQKLLRFAGKLESRSKIASAASLYDLAAHEAPETARFKAQARLEALSGRGRFGARTETLARGFFRQAFDPTALAAMIGAQAVFGVSRAFLLSRMASASANVLTRGPTAKLLASAGAFALEAPSFTLLTKAAQAAMGSKPDWGAATLHREVAASYLSLGALKLGGSAASRLQQRLVPQLNSPILAKTIQQGGMLGGILAGHEAEVRAGLRPKTDSATTFYDALAMLAQLQVSGRLLHSLAPKLEAWNRAWQTRAEFQGEFGLKLRPESAAALTGLGLFLKTLPAQAAVEGAFDSDSLSLAPWLFGLSTLASGLVFLQRAKLKPRPYQVEMLENLRADMLRGDAPWLGLASPMQTGKSTLSRYLIPMAEELYGPDTHFLILSSSRIITSQLVQDLLGENPEVGRLDGLVKDPRRITVASIFTLQQPKLLEAFPCSPGKLVIVLDEAFHTQAPIVRRILRHFGVGQEQNHRLTPLASSNTHLIGLSGTGSSLEGYKLSGHLDLLRALEEGWVRPMRGERVFPNIDTQAIQSASEKMIWWKANEANAEALAKIYLEKIQSYKNSLLYVPTIRHGELLKAAIEKATKSEVRFLHSKLEPEVIQKSLETWQQEGGPLISVRMLSQGFRAGEVGAVFHTYQSSSAELFAQRTGRAWGVGQAGEGSRLYVLEATWDKERFSNLATLLGLVEYPGRRLETGKELFDSVRRIRSRSETEAEIQAAIVDKHILPAFAKVPEARAWRERFKELLKETGGLDKLQVQSNLRMESLYAYTLGILPISLAAVMALEPKGALVPFWVESWKQILKEVAQGERIGVIHQLPEFWKPQGDLQEQARQLSEALRRIFPNIKELGSAERNSLVLNIETPPHSLKARLTQEQIDTILRAIVAQDTELYPEGSAESMCSASHFWHERWYRVGQQDLNLNTLARRERQARGLKSDDRPSLLDSQIFRDWKLRIWGIESKKVVRDSLELKGDFQRADPKRWSQAEIDAVLLAIVTQDSAQYPDGSAAEMSTSRRFWSDRWYRIGEDELTLNTLAVHERQARGLLRAARAALSNSQVLRDWKSRIWGIENEKVVRDSLKLKGVFKRADPNHWNLEDIDAILRAIVAQDAKLYPNASASNISTSPRFWSDRWYRIEGEEFGLRKLSIRERQIRGFRSDDRASLSDSQILQDWKRRVWGIENEKRRDSLELKGDLAPSNSKRWSQEDIDKVLRAIVAQDSEIYPEKSAEGISRSANLWMNRWYRVNGKDLTLNTLAYRERQARGLRVGDHAALADTQIIRDWKLRIWGIESKKVVRDSLELKGDFQRADPKRWSQAEIDAALRAIVTQDSELYPDGSAASISTGRRFWSDRWYRIGEDELTLNTLAIHERQARGLLGTARAVLSNGQVLRDWKLRVWGIVAGKHVERLPPLE